MHRCIGLGALHGSELQSTTVLAGIVESIMMNCMTGPEQLSTAFSVSPGGHNRGDSGRTTSDSLAEQYESGKHHEERHDEQVP